MYRGEPNVNDVAYQERCRSRVAELERRNMCIFEDDPEYDRYAKLLILQKAAAEYTSDQRRDAFDRRYLKVLGYPNDGMRRMLTTAEQQHAEEALEAARYLVQHDQAARQNNAILFSQPETIDEGTYRRLEMPFVYEMLRLMCTSSESQMHLLALDVQPPQQVRWVAPGIPEEGSAGEGAQQEADRQAQEDADLAADLEAADLAVNTGVPDDYYTPEPEVPVEAQTDHPNHWVHASVDDGLHHDPDGSVEPDHHDGVGDDSADHHGHNDDSILGF